MSIPKTHHGVTRNAPSPPPTRSQQYMDSLVPPSPEDFERIAQVQQQREEAAKRKLREQKRKSLQDQQCQLTASGSQEDAAKTIQRTFRGYRTRRELRGFSLDASTRWITAIREAQFRHSVQPRAKATGDLPRASGDKTTSPARDAWKKASVIAWRAGLDDLSDTSASSASDAAAHVKNDKQARKKETRIMGLQYFLEMVDLKHRHGSNLRKYHQLWAKSDTKENFFYWLDHGEGKDIEAPKCPREKLERQRVRYLSAHERQHYLVVVDSEGRLVWAKNHVRVDTSERFKDSLEGIVPSDDPTPAYDPANQQGHPTQVSSSNSSSESSDDSTDEVESTSSHKEQTEGLHEAKLASVSPISKLVNRSAKKKSKWIFVTDTSFRLYIGIKNSGAFQHSSFLQGSRISAAGLIRIKDGQLRSLQPLSGHYRPPLSNFRAFVHNLEDAGVDLSRVSIKKSYAVIVGLEMYVKTKHQGRRVKERMLHGRDKIVAPEEARKRREEAQDKSESAKKEKEFLENQKREENVIGIKLMQQLGGVAKEPKGQREDISRYDEK